MDIHISKGWLWAKSTSHDLYHRKFNNMQWKQSFDEPRSSTPCVLNEHQHNDAIVSTIFLIHLSSTLESKHSFEIVTICILFKRPRKKLHKTWIELTKLSWILLNSCTCELSKLRLWTKICQKMMIFIYF